MRRGFRVKGRDAYGMPGLGVRCHDLLVANPAVEV